VLVRRRLEPGGELGDMGEQMVTATLGLRDHLGEAGLLLLERLDLDPDPLQGVVEDRPALGRVARASESHPVTRPSRFVL
jgi:hypothetical protein